MESTPPSSALGYVLVEIAALAAIGENELQSLFGFEALVDTPRRQMLRRGSWGYAGKVARVFAATLTLLIALFNTAPVRADSAPPGQRAIGFSRLVARIQDDRIGIAGAEVRVHILEALRQAGYYAVGAESLVFDQDESDRAELVLGGTVKELDCQVIDSTVRCSMGVEWEVMDRARRAVVYRVLSRFALIDASERTPEDVGTKLTLGALKSLLARPRFKQLLQVDARPADVKYPLSSFARCAAPERHLPGELDAVTAGTVLIKTDLGLGSGFYLGSDGLVLTAAHVVEGASIRVVARGEEARAARVVRVSRTRDVALLSVAPVDPLSRPCLDLRATTPAPGSDVYAIGSPASEELAFSVSRGIVSGLRTSGDVPLIQTDASLNPGNSGGPLVDPQGRVAGIVTSKLAGHALEGLGFALPIQSAISALQLEPGATTSADLLAAAPPLAAAAPKIAVDDVPDARPSLDPEGDKRREEERRREEEEAARRRLADASRSEPPPMNRTDLSTTIQILRWGGAAVAVAGAVGVLATASENQGPMKRSEYEDLALQNDVSWVAVIAGSGLFVTSFALNQSRQANASGRWFVAAGPNAVRLKASF